jgi:hypothetical protein
MIAMLTCALLLGGADPRVTVHLSIDQDGGLSTLQLQLAVDEVRNIWKDAGVDVTSGLYGDPSQPGDASISLRIMLTPTQIRRDGGPILAWVTRPSTGLMPPALFVSLAGLTAAMSGAEYAGLPIGRVTHDLRDRLIAQAIGRVVAHELGHYLLQSAGHEGRGLMRATYTATELAGAWLGPFQVPSAQRTAVRQEISALARLQAAF